mmetsp:Transcript_27666/g.50238  ORF Transcript_27666/g.50238 Transcript_27666/m.50238 type:complete len:225 (+) Transcript_27666:509-1183(+)
MGGLTALRCPSASICFILVTAAFPCASPNRCMGGRTNPGPLATARFIVAIPSLSSCDENENDESLSSSCFTSDRLFRGGRVRWASTLLNRVRLIRLFRSPRFIPVLPSSPPPQFHSVPTPTENDDVVAVVVLVSGCFFFVLLLCGDDRFRRRVRFTRLDTLFVTMRFVCFGGFQKSSSSSDELLSSSFSTSSLSSLQSPYPYLRAKSMTPLALPACWGGTASPG